MTWSLWAKRLQSLAQQSPADSPAHGAQASQGSFPLLLPLPLLLPPGQALTRMCCTSCPKENTRPRTCPRQGGGNQRTPTRKFSPHRTGRLCSKERTTCSM